MRLTGSMRGKRREVLREQTSSGSVGGPSGGTTTANVGSYEVPIGRVLRRIRVLKRIKKS